MLNTMLEIKNLDSMEDGFFLLDEDWHYTYLNKRTAEKMNVSSSDITGRTIWEVSPSLIGTELENAYRSVMKDRVIKRIETKGFTGSWYNIIAFPNDNGISVYWQDITKAKEAEEALRVSDQSKSAFIATLSHELRNPMASIMLGTSLLRQDPLVGKIANKAIEIIERQSTQLNRLVDDLLDVTRISQNKITLDREKIELNNLMGLILHEHKESFDEKGIHVDASFSGVPLYLSIDLPRFSQVIGNLLDNALKFTNQGGNIYVTVDSDETKTKAVITIKDTGVGIRPEIQSHLFKPFIQADMSLNHSNGGLGLGLAIAKGMIELHGGIIGLYSEGLGKGTSFEIAMPLLIDACDQESAICGPSSEAPSRALRILVIDDIPDLTEILSAVLSNLGHHVLTACDGTQGIASAKADKPDVLICDIGLPGMNGYEIAEVFRRDSVLKNTFLIALSGYAQPEDLEKSKKAGFHQHLSKPANLDLLKMALAEAYYYKNIVQ